MPRLSHIFFTAALGVCLLVGCSAKNKRSSAHRPQVITNQPPAAEYNHHEMLPMDSNPHLIAPPGESDYSAPPAAPPVAPPRPMGTSSTTPAPMPMPMPVESAYDRPAPPAPPSRSRKPDNFDDGNSIDLPVPSVRNESRDSGPELRPTNPRVARNGAANTGGLLRYFRERNHEAAPQSNVVEVKHNVQQFDPVIGPHPMTVTPAEQDASVQHLHALMTKQLSNGN